MKVAIPDLTYKQLVAYQFMQKKLPANILKELAYRLNKAGIVNKDAVIRAEHNTKPASMIDIFGYGSKLLDYISKQKMYFKFHKNSEEVSSFFSDIFSVKKWKDGAHYKLFGFNIYAHPKDLKKIATVAKGVGTVVGAGVGVLTGNPAAAQIGGAIGASYGNVLAAIGATKMGKVVKNIKKGQDLGSAMKNAGLTDQEQQLLLNALQNTKMNVDSISNPQHVTDNNIKPSSGTDELLKKYAPFALSGLAALLVIALMRR